MFLDTFKGLDQDSIKKMLSIGPKWAEDIISNRQIVIDIYSALLQNRDLENIFMQKDMPYGSHQRQVLDIYHQADLNSPAPVVIFVHGGAFVRGEKNSNDHIYSNFLTYFVRHGYVGINLEYRHATEAKFPEGSKDIESGVAWVVKHAKELNIDPSRIFLVGHSAGGTHVASYVMDPNVRPQHGHSIAGLILISARLRADVRADNPNAGGVRAYYGEDSTLYELRSPLTYADHLDIPVLIAISEFENPGLDVYASELFHRVSTQKWQSPAFIKIPKHNHTSIVAHIDTEEETFGLFMRSFMSEVSSNIDSI
jgi:acetyl esterase/lipase